MQRILCRLSQTTSHTNPGGKRVHDFLAAKPVKPYGAGARSPLNSVVPLLKSTLHVTTALPLILIPGGLKFPLAETEHDEDHPGVSQPERPSGRDSGHRRRR
jgi:hypothetical protein